MIEKDTKELEEVVTMLLTEPDADQGVVAHLSFGNYVVIREELFLKVVESINSQNLEEGDV